MVAIVDRFHWTVFDVRSMLPSDWREQIITVARNFARDKVLITQHSTSREARSDLHLSTQSVGGNEVAIHLPWLRQLYQDEFRQLAQLTTAEPVSLMSDDRFAVVLNVQSGSNRYECHVD